MPYRKEMRELLTHAYVDPERLRKIGEAMANVVAAEIQIPSYMRMVVEHQKENPHKSPMQCMRDTVEPYEKMRAEAIRKSIEK